MEDLFELLYERLERLGVPLDSVDEDVFCIVPSLGNAVGQIRVDRASDSGDEIRVEFIDYKRQCLQNGFLEVAVNQGIDTLEDLIVFCDENVSSYDEMVYSPLKTGDIGRIAHELRDLSAQMEEDFVTLSRALSSSVEESAHGRRGRKRRAVEKIHGVNERDNGVRMVTFAQANKGRSLEDFAERARNLSWIKSMSESDAQCMIAFGCVVLARLSGMKQLEVWDFLFGRGSDPIITNKSAHDIVLLSYYDENSSMKPSVDGVAEGMYHFWHDTPMVQAIKDTYLKSRSQDAAYLAGVCASGGVLDDEGNLHFPDGSVVDFDALSTGGSLKKEKRMIIRNRGRHYEAEERTFPDKVLVKVKGQIAELTEAGWDQQKIVQMLQDMGISFTRAYGYGFYCADKRCYRFLCQALKKDDKAQKAIDAGKPITKASLIKGLDFVAYAMNQALKKGDARVKVGESRGRRFEELTVEDDVVEISLEDIINDSCQMIYGSYDVSYQLDSDLTRWTYTIETDSGAKDNRTFTLDVQESGLSGRATAVYEVELGEIVDGDFESIEDEEFRCTWSGDWEDDMGSLCSNIVNWALNLIDKEVGR